MTTPRLLVAAAAGVLALTGCSNKSSYHAGSASPAHRGTFDEFCSMVPGTYSNAQQARERDKDGKPIWMNVELHIVEFHPPAGVDTAVLAAPYSRWFYIEQAEVGMLDKPYRQHISALHATSDGGFATQVYTFTGDAYRFAGWWKHPESFTHHLTSQDLDAREGCEVVMRPTDDGGFTGGTAGNGCPNTSRGAAYATSEATITPDEIRAWDRGYDASGRQVWGSRTGPYIFKKK